LILRKDSIQVLMATTVLSVPDISCEHCERAITNALMPVEGVHAVQVDIPAKQVRVDYDEATVDINRMKAILQEEDYPVESVA
jgi:copper chaperone